MFFWFFLQFKFHSSHVNNVNKHNKNRQTDWTGDKFSSCGLCTRRFSLEQAGNTTRDKWTSLALVAWLGLLVIFRDFPKNGAQKRVQPKQK